MQKKMVGIIASVAVAHGILAIALMTGGGCRQTKILAPHTYNNGPEVSQVPSAVDKPVEQSGQLEVPHIGDTPLPPPVEQKPQPTAVVTPPAAPTPAAAGTKTYKVKKGDTLSAIAYKHGVRTRDLAACNNISGKAMNNIRIGQELTIPEGGVYNENRKPKRSAKKAAVKPAKKSAKPAKKADLPADGIYVVKSGDSLDRIGRRYGVSAKAIAKENNIALTKVLQIGDKLRIPGKTAAPAKTTDTAAADNSATTSQVPAVNSDELLNDLDANAGLENSSATTPAATAPAAAAASENTAAATTADPAQYDSLEVPEDMTVEDFCSRNKVSVDVIRKLNPEIPADGKLKAGAYLTLPRVQD